MRLLRVQVPEFRALKDVDISFEPEFTPQVFPLGSLNGGGKSTLLQLIFVLLHCFWDEKHREHFKNIAAELKDNYQKSKINNLATIHILSNSGEVCLEYFYGNEKSIRELRNNSRLNDNICGDYYGYYDSFYFLGTVTFIDTQNITDKITNNVIQEIREKIFLISPVNQNYLFLSLKERRLLFTSDNEKPYNQILKGLKGSLPNFFTYDFIDVLAEVFRFARDKDYRERNKKAPFAYSEKLENDVNNLFIDGKKVIPITIEQQRHIKDSIQSVAFKLPSGKEIYPEDLSHGELKRLTIFVLLKYHEMKDSIVLFDEIENAFHPRWQRYIVDDLVEWQPSNQYILATHSYELCRGVTPAHIKELPPNLFPKS